MDKHLQMGQVLEFSSTGKNLAYHLYLDDFAVVPVNNIWTDLLQRTSKIYVVDHFGFGGGYTDCSKP